MALTVNSNDRPQSRARSDQGDFNLIFGMSFVVFLVAATAERLLPGHWMGANGRQQSRKSIIRQALDSARTVVPYAFMG